MYFASLIRNLNFYVVFLSFFCFYFFLLHHHWSMGAPHSSWYSPHSSSSSPPRVSSGMLVVARLPLDVVIATLYRGFSSRFPRNLSMMRVNLFVTFIC